METTNLLLTAALAFASGTGFFFLGPGGWQLLQRTQRSLRQARLQGNAQSGVVLALHRLLSRGVACFRPLVALLVRWPPLGAVADEAAILLREKGFIGAQSQGVVGSVLAGLCGVLVLGSILLGSLLSALALALALGAVLVFFVRSETEKRVGRVRLCVPDSIQAMKSCFQAGLSLEQTLAYLVQHSCGEMSAAYGHALQSLRLGGSAIEALDGLRQEIHAPEFAFVMVALEVQHRTGGSLANVLQDAEQAARSQFELERSLRVQTAQARLSARVVSALPLVLIGVFSLITEGFLEPFFSSATGLFLFVLAVVMQVAGVLMVRRTLRVRGVSS